MQISRVQWINALRNAGWTPGARHREPRRTRRFNASGFNGPDPIKFY